MKRYFSLVVCIFAFAFISCATTETYKELENYELEQYDIIGSVTSTFIASTVIGGGIISDNVRKESYRHLIEEAREGYDGDFDIRNITISLKRKINSGGVFCEWIAAGDVVVSK
jgi:hypothetical protein